MDSLLKAVDVLIGLIKRVGATALTGMMVVTVIDVILRKVGTPIFGAVEIVSFMATIVLACAMPLTHVEKGHVGVDLFVRRYSDKTRNSIDMVTSGLAAVLFGLVTWQMYLYAGDMRRSGEVSMSLEFPTYYIVYLVAIAFGVLTLVIAVEFLQRLRKVFSS